MIRLFEYVLICSSFHVHNQITKLITLTRSVSIFKINNDVMPSTAPPSMYVLVRTSTNTSTVSISNLILGLTVWLVGVNPKRRKNFQKKKKKNL